MSDEQTPPPSPLRLKPRLLSTAAPFPPSGSPADTGSPDATPPESTNSAPPPPAKISLKPRTESTRPEGAVAAEPGKSETFGVPPPVYPPFVPSGQDASGMSSPVDKSNVTSPALDSIGALSVTSPAPSAVTPPPPEVPPASGEAEPGKFKLKPKMASPAVPNAPPPVVLQPRPAPVILPPAVPPLVAPPPALSVPPLPAPAASPSKVPPPFPVVAPGTTPKPATAIPQLKLKTPVVESASPIPTVPPEKRGSRRSLILVAAVILIAAGVIFGRRFVLKPAVVPPPASKAKAVVPTPAPAPVATTTPTPANTPSETLNKLANAPVNAINKAQEAIATRRASGQARIDAAVTGEDVPDKPATPPAPAATKSSTAPAKSTGGMTTIAPGVTTTTELEAGAEASAAFRAFIANAKVSGVFQGSPARAFINGRLIRAGENVDGPLGVVFTGIDVERKQLLFKDRTGATVARKY